MPVASYTSIPAVTLGGDLNTVAMTDVMTVEIDEDIDGMCALELELLVDGPVSDSGEYPYLDRKALDFGTKISVTLGPPGSSALFDGRVSALGALFPASGIAVVQVKAEDGLQELRRARRTRTFADKSVAGIANELAGEYGLSAQVGGGGLSRTVVAQLNLSDLAFLRQLAQSEGSEVWLDGLTINVQPRTSRDAGSVTLNYGAQLNDFTVSADLAHQMTTFAVTGWSVDDKKLIRETADYGQLGAELGQDVSGAELLKNAFAERDEALVVAEPLDGDDARLRATAGYLERARRFVTGTGSCSGDPRIRVGTLVTLGGLGRLFNGDYRVVRTRHCWSLDEAYTTEFDVERVGLGKVS